MRKDPHKNFGDSKVRVSPYLQTSASSLAMVLYQIKATEMVDIEYRIWVAMKLIKIQQKAETQKNAVNPVKWFKSRKMK